MDENTETENILVQDFYPTLTLGIEEGTFLMFPQGVKAFADKHRAEAVCVNPNGDIEVLRAGLDNSLLRWVSIVDDA